MPRLYQSLRILLGVWGICPHFLCHYFHQDSLFPSQSKSTGICSSVRDRSACPLRDLLPSYKRLPQKLIWTGKAQLEQKKPGWLHCCPHLNFHPKVCLWGMTAWELLPQRDWGPKCNACSTLILGKMLASAPVQPRGRELQGKTRCRFQGRCRRASSASTPGTALPSWLERTPKGQRVFIPTSQASLECYTVNWMEE